jgi:nucleotide-binding universal stress UspA family protein
MYKRILVATGGSPWSDAAVAYAIALADQTGAEVHILAVLNVPATAVPMEGMAFINHLVASAACESKALLAQAAARAARAGVAYATVMRWGNVPDAILRTAIAEDCDLIILGSRGLTRRKRLMLESISSTVAAKAQRPVLVVKQPPPHARGSRLWRRVLVATGGSPWSDAAVDHALMLARHQRLEVCLLHVERGRPRRTGPAAAAGKNILTLGTACAIAAGVPYETTLASSDIAEAILETAIRKQCDVIVLGSRGLSGWKRLMRRSISNTVAMKAALPVLIVKRFVHREDDREISLHERRER